MMRLEPLKPILWQTSCRMQNYLIEHNIMQSQQNNYSKSNLNNNTLP